ncbi:MULTISPECIES: hypothetical protein [Allobacillus]|uniref:Uncharacterized protein n=1 Tax=Allobacillus salarius TaxID=1955272 RepID=A0A556PPE2_9BACI|nr:hypothetical protein [Allobacillus salarius]TSJ66261.1 hypothetical protein FPQ13_05185 [Allobacillus salarius]
MKPVKILTALVILSIAFAVPAFAESDGDEAYSMLEDIKRDEVPVERTIFIDKGVKVDLLEDGRVAPVRNVKSLNEEQLDEILSYANFSKEDLNYFDIEQKRQFVATGIKKVDSEISTKEIYNSISGEKYVITEENIDEVNQIKRMDNLTLESLTKDSGFSTQSTKYYNPFRSWSGRSLILYVGTYGNDFIYNMYQAFQWDNFPGYGSKNRFAVSADHYHRLRSVHGESHCATGGTYCNNVSYSPEPAGAAWTTLLMTHTEKQNMYAYQHFFIDQSRSNHNHTVRGSYINPTISGTTVGVNIGWASISWEPFYGDERHITHNYTVYPNY